MGSPGRAVARGSGGEVSRDVEGLSWPGACFFQTWGALAPGDAKQDVTELPCPGRGRLLEWAVLAAGGLMGLGAGAPG